jgi:hypothetical protein
MGLELAAQVAFSDSAVLEEDAGEALRDQVLAAVAAAEEHTKEGVVIAADRLRANFQVVAQAVLELDHHLLDPKEISQINQFLVGS